MASHTHSRVGGRGALLLAATLASGLGAAARPAAAQIVVPADQPGVARCTQARALLEGKVGMATIVEPDTLDDWRTHLRLPGCRVTAAGTTTRTAAEQATWFYETVQAAGWTRTPDPRDAPNEASLRFRMGGNDCLFNVYTGGILGTDAELQVDRLRVPLAGEIRYNVLALCVEAREAAG